MPAHPADAAAIAELHAQSWRETYGPMLPPGLTDDALYANRVDLWTARFAVPAAGRDLILKATHDRDIVAFACLASRSDREHGRLLDNLHVRREWKRQGLGRRLLARAASAALPSGAMHLWVVGANMDAARFYEMLGGVPLDVRADELLPAVRVEEVRYVWRGASLRLLADAAA